MKPDLAHPHMDCDAAIQRKQDVARDLLMALTLIHKRATPRSQDFLHPTKKFANDVATLANNAIRQANKKGVSL